MSCCFTTEPKSGRHDPWVTLRLTYVIFSELLGSMVLRARSDISK